MPAYSVVAASPDPKIREMEKEAIAEENLSAVLCGDGEEVLESVRNTKDPPLRLLVIEACLTKTDGFEVVRILSEDENFKTLPSLMLLDPKQSPAAQKTAVRLGADDYLQKPFEQEELRAKIHSMTKHFRAHAAPHPVTGLPGHPQLEQALYARTNKGEAFELVCFDINYFRPFNDHYGSDKGDEAIRMVVHLIKGVLKSSGISSTEEGVMSHIDGDDFIIMAAQGRGDKIRRELREKFQSEVQKFYSKEEIKKGFIFQKDRENKDQIFPLMRLSTAVLTVAKEKFAHYGELVTEINEALRQSKVGSQDI